MKGPGFLLLLALNLACNQQVVFDFSLSSERVGGSNNEFEEGKFHIKACVVTNVIEIVGGPVYIHSGEFANFNSQQALFNYPHENGDVSNTYKSGDEKNDQGSVSALTDDGGDWGVAGFVSVCENGGGRDYNEVDEYGCGRDYNEVDEYGCGNVYIDSVSQVGAAVYCPK